MISFREKVIRFAYTVVSVILGHVAGTPMGAWNCAESRTLYTVFFFSLTFTPSHLKEAFYGLSLAHPNGQHHCSWVPGALWSKIRVTPTQALPHLDCQSGNGRLFMTKGRERQRRSARFKTYELIYFRNFPVNIFGPQLAVGSRRHRQAGTTPQIRPLCLIWWHRWFLLCSLAITWKTLCLSQPLPVSELL